MGFPSGSNGKQSACSAGDPGLIPGSGRSPEVGNGKPLQHSCLGKFHGQRSLAGYSPRGPEELDVTEHACLLTFCGACSSQRQPREGDPPGHWTVRVRKRFTQFLASILQLKERAFPGDSSHWRAGAGSTLHKQQPVHGG